jgi:long-chain acyl-CoA synthetase
MNAKDNLAQLLWSRAEAAQHEEFLITPEGSWTYQNLQGRCAAFADRIAADDIRVVGCMLRNGPALVAAMFGAWSVGASVALLNAGLSVEERDQALKDVAAPVLLTDHALAGTTESDVPRWFVEDLDEFDDAFSGKAERQPVPMEADRDAAVVFTSGTTGRPKGAALTHGRLLQASSALAVALRGKPGPYPIARPTTPPNLIAIPLAQTGGLTTMIFAIVVGRRLLIVEKFRPALIGELAVKHRIDTLVGTPTMFQMLATHDGPLDLSTVRFAQSTGAPLTEAVKNKFEQRFNVPIIQNYGQTETGHVAGWTREDLASGTWRPGAVGRPYEGVEIEIRDDDGHVLPTGEVGEIWVRSPHTMRGYVGPAEAANAEVMVRGWLRTGDLGRIDEEGYLYLVSRKREMLICGGFNVYPAEVEQALLSHPGVRDAVVFGVPDERLGEIPVGVVVRSDPALTAEALVDHCRSKIAHFKAVRRVSFVEAFPMTESNKIRRAKVRDDYLGASL